MYALAKLLKTPLKKSHDIHSLQLKNGKFKLTNLQVSNVKYISDEFVYQFCHNTKETISKLNLNESKLSDQVLDVLSLTTNLVSLELPNSNITDSGLLLLLNLKHQLKKLNISYTKIKLFSHAISVLYDELQSLEVLDISGLVLDSQFDLFFNVVRF